MDLYRADLGSGQPGAEEQPSKVEKSSIDPGAKGAEDRASAGNNRPHGERGSTSSGCGLQELAGSEVAPHLLRELSAGADEPSGVTKQLSNQVGDHRKEDQSEGVETPIISGSGCGTGARDELEEELGDEETPAGQRIQLPGRSVDLTIDRFSSSYKDLQA